MTGPLAEIGATWQALDDMLADFQTDMLRRTASQMADALDRAAQQDVEGVRDWRDLSTARKENRYASTRS